MILRMPARTFEQWVDCIFDHPVADPAWYFDVDADTCEECDEVTVEYLTCLFRHSGRVLARFDDAQANQGLNMIADVACSQHAVWVTHPGVPWPKRKACIASIYDLYADCFAARCAPVLSHGVTTANPLNYICYMWWDVFPAWGDPVDASRSESAAFLDVMGQCLTLGNPACVEGALHGLGHWHYLFPQRVEAIIDGFVRGRTDLSPELMMYVRRAREGDVP
jgi:hypothetical protein